MPDASHTPVLLQETIDGLAPQKGDIVLDGTIGGGGHSAAICKHIGKSGTLIGIDQDSNTLARAKTYLDEVCDCAVKLVCENFRDLDRVLEHLEVAKVHRIVFDLGMSSFQLEVSGRGFAFRKDEPLVMSFSAEQAGGVTARDIVNEWSEETLAAILKGFGEERFARRIAARIVAERAKKPIERTTELVDIIAKAVPARYRHGKTHFATRTFQALRIATNDEVNALKEGLAKGFEALAAGGRMAVITFHSIEDRIVKRFFKEKAKGGEGRFITKKPVTPSKEEIAKNKKARSAKLRVIEKTQLS